MPLRRKKPKAEPNAPVIEGAICVHTFRPGAIAVLIERGQQVPLNHPAVAQFPEYFRGLVALVEQGDT